MPGEGTTVLWGALFDLFDPVRWPLQVAYTDHSHLEYHGAAAGHVDVVLLRAFEQACRGF